LLPAVLRNHQEPQGEGPQITLPNGVRINGVTEQHVLVALKLRSEKSTEYLVWDNPSHDQQQH